MIIPGTLARELGVPPYRVRALVKWYAIRHGKSPSDYVRPYPHEYSKNYVYAMPDDFRDFVLQELGLTEVGQ